MISCAQQLVHTRYLVQVQEAGANIQTSLVLQIKNAIFGVFDLCLYLCFPATNSAAYPSLSTFPLLKKPKGDHDKA